MWQIYYYRLFSEHLNLVIDQSKYEICSIDLKTKTNFGVGILKSSFEPLRGFSWQKEINTFMFYKDNCFVYMQDLQNFTKVNIGFLLEKKPPNSWSPDSESTGEASFVYLWLFLSAWVIFHWCHVWNIFSHQSHWYT